MKLVVLKETAAFEERVALTPEVTKKLSDKGHQIGIQSKAGEGAGFSDKDFQAAGAKIYKDVATTVKGADVLLRVSPPTVTEVAAYPKKSVLVTLLKPHENAKLITKLAAQQLTTVGLELIPRISRAQSMDVLSSQSNLAGYKAVIDAVSLFGRAIPMMMTAAGTIPPARVLVIGAGVAGLQAIATAKRLGAIVSAFDVRPAVKEQVESLGAKFVEVDSSESGEAKGGYAKEMSAAYKKRQTAKLAAVVADQDIIITTAQIPGKPAPCLITEAMIQTMKPGSVIVDLAVESGGNVAGTKLGKVLKKKGVILVGYANVPSRLAHDASQVYARNIMHLLTALSSADGKQLNFDFKDEIVAGATVTHAGKVIHPEFK